MTTHIPAPGAVPSTHIIGSSADRSDRIEKAGQTIADNVDTGVRGALVVAAVVGAVGAHRRDAMRRVPAHLRRSITSARELWEAAEMAHRGEMLPGTRAHSLYSAATEAGDFAKAGEIVAWVKAQAPKITEEARRAEIHEARAAAVTEASTRVQMSRLDRAEAKRQRKNNQRRALVSDDANGVDVVND